MVKYSDGVFWLKDFSESHRFFRFLLKPLKDLPIQFGINTLMEFGITGINTLMGNPIRVFAGGLYEVLPNQFRI